MRNFLIFVNNHSYFRVKTEYAKYAKKQKATGGGPPPTPPKFDPLMEATADLIRGELQLADEQYDSLCRDVPKDDGLQAAPSKQDGMIIINEEDCGKKTLYLLFLTFSNIINPHNQISLCSS